MRRFTHLLFGVAMPLLEVLLVLAGLLVLGWESLDYARTGLWHTIPLGAPLAAAIGPGSPVPGWLLRLPLSGACIVGGIALFFVMPPAYAFS